MTDQSDTEAPTIHAAAPRPKAGGSGLVFDSATLFGILGAFALMGTAIALGGSPSSFVNAPSLLIVLGATLLLTAASFSWGDVFRSAAVIRNTVVHRRREPVAAALRVLELADYARRHGILKLQGTPMQGLKDEPLLHKGLELVIDNVPEHEIESMLRGELSATFQRQTKASGVLRRAAEIAPAMGLIGTLVGLVQMLSRLEDPSTIGPAMAVALLTTFYGAILANMVFIPLASKLDRNAQDEAQVNHIFLLGTLSIGRKDNPRRLEMQINSTLPSGQQVRFFD